MRETTLPQQREPWLDGAAAHQNMTAQPQHFFDQTPDDLRTLCASLDMPAYTATQLLSWVYGKGVVELDAMTDIAVRNREALREHLRFYGSTLVAHRTASDGTQKLLLRWPADRAASRGATNGLKVLGADESGRDVETVMIPTPRRRTACLSSQVGCPVGCRFCASGLGGLEINLKRGQIVEQAHRLNFLPDSERLSNIVFMGMGEPLSNYRAVTDAIGTLNADWGLGISARRITVSTVGLPAAIRKLADFELPVTLALSLHAPNDAVRRQLIPWAEYTSVAELVDACNEYFQKSGREITFEYLLLRNVNDRPEHARELAAVARKLRANVNLIRYNEVAGLPYERPTDEDVRRFQDILRSHRINAHIRASRGRDIEAACGQLRHEMRSSAPSTC